MICEAFFFSREICSETIRTLSSNVSYWSRGLCECVLRNCRELLLIRWKKKKKKKKKNELKQKKKKQFLSVVRLPHFGYGYAYNVWSYVCASSFFVYIHAFIRRRQVFLFFFCLSPPFLFLSIDMFQFTIFELNYSMFKYLHKETSGGTKKTAESNAFGIEGSTFKSKCSMRFFFLLSNNQNRRK